MCYYTMLVKKYENYCRDSQYENTAEAPENGKNFLLEQLQCNQSFIINETAIPTLNIWNN